jgi:hypothetical protein
MSELPPGSVSPLTQTAAPLRFGWDDKGGRSTLAVGEMDGQSQRTMGPATMQTVLSTVTLSNGNRPRVPVMALVRHAG